MLSKNYVLVTAAMALSIAGLGLSSKVLADCGDCEKAKGTGKVREGFNQPLILSGIKTIKIAVGELDSYMQQQGATKEHLKEKLKEGLSTTHATITEDAAACCKDKNAKAGKEDSAPILYLKVRSSEATPNPGVYSINVSLVEKSKITRNHKEIMAAVWSRDLVSKVGADTKSELDNNLDLILKDFRRDYQLANSADISHPGMPDEQGRKKPVYTK